METVYQVRRVDVEGFGWSEDMTQAEALDFLHRRFKAWGGSVRLAMCKPYLGEFGRKRSPWQAKLKLKQRLSNAGVGAVFACASAGGGRYRVRKIERGLLKREPNFPDAYDIDDVRPSLQEAIKAGAAFDYGVKCSGLAYTRYIEGTTTYSQHSRRKRLACKGNAADLYFPLPPPIGNDLPRQRRLVGFYVANAVELELGMVISEKTFWHEGYGFEPRYYGGIAHVGHTHIEGPAENGEVC